MKKWNGFEHGINFGGWLSQCDHTKERYDTFIVEKDFETVAKWGLDHVRIPVDYELVEDESGNYQDEGFSYIQFAIDECRKNGLHMILDLHRTFGYSFDEHHVEKGFFENEAYQERFYRLWEEFAKRFSSNEDILAFELLNEVTKSEYRDTWNRVSDTCIKRIRSIAPTIKIVVGGYHYNNIESLPYLNLPQDENIIYNFHFYEPIILTHQGASWMDRMDRSFRINADATYEELTKATRDNVDEDFEGFPGMDPAARLSAEFFERKFEKAARLAEERGTSLYCGEYGSIDLSGGENTLKWYRLISSAFEKYGIGRAAWTYRQMDFGINDPYMDGIRDEVIKLL
ncbi:MAG: cellulase family glycosylhydrolase [Lachnospiraceae bacterium]|nr:cellulase family glycosylhydrolase [Lachnospiraceae bacterium]